VQRRRATLVTAAVAASVAVATSPWAAAAGGGRTHEVVIQGLQNIPATLKVRRGDVVVWTNKDPFPHTVTAKGVFDSKAIAEGHSWRWTANRTGTFNYICTLHSNMKGTLQVE
jgi:plastocyanin